jgi:hypothetical protein
MLPSVMAGPAGCFGLEAIALYITRRRGLRAGGLGLATAPKGPLASKGADRRVCHPNLLDCLAFRTPTAFVSHLPCQGEISSSNVRSRAKAIDYQSLSWMRKRHANSQGPQIFIQAVRIPSSGRPDAGGVALLKPMPRGPADGRGSRTQGRRGGAPAATRRVARSLRARFS